MYINLMVVYIYIYIHTSLVSITLFNIVNMGVHCRPQPRDIYFTTVYIVNYF